MIVVGVAVFAAMVNFAFHRIEEGHVGVYYRGGALLSNIASPGFHLMVPFLTHFRYYANWFSNLTMITEMFVP